MWRPVLFFIIILTGIFSSCRSTKKIQTAITKKDTSVVQNVVPEFDTAAFIKENYLQIQKNRIGFTTFSAKADVDYEDGDGKKYNVNANIRMYKDSVIWISVTAVFGIEGLRAYITKDSVKIIDKQNKIYTARSVSYLQEVTALPLDLTSVQDLMIGNPVFLDSNIISFSKAENRLSFVSMGSFFKNILTIGEVDKLIQSCKLDDQDVMNSRSSFLTFTDYESKNDVAFASRRTINVTDKKHLEIKLHFKQYAFNETLTFPFSVQKNYKRN